MLNLYLLMYADDMVLFSESMHELQKIIDVVNLYSNEYDLYINMSKICNLETEVIVSLKKNGS